MFRKILCALLCVMLLAPGLVAGEAETGPAGDAAEPEAYTAPEELIVTHPTATKGDFFTEMFGNDTRTSTCGR